ncbi:palmitoyltransferase for Vac8p [Apophysomyces sp. BC1034]|nr:palmitoyltransferase for Vac8p [Apophysomyces sp. BC1034]
MEFLESDPNTTGTFEGKLIKAWTQVVKRKTSGEIEAEEAMDIYNDTEDVQLLNHNHDAEDEDEEEENMKHPNVAILNVEAAESTTSLNRPTASSRRKHNSYTSITVKRDGDHRFCKKCQLRKFDRAHHCRICKRCTLKMDQ